MAFDDLIIFIAMFKIQSHTIKSESTDQFPFNFNELNLFHMENYFVQINIKTNKIKIKS